LGWNQLLETGGVVVGDEVKIPIDAEIVAKDRVARMTECVFEAKEG
jgi:hypothetical protein